MMDAREGGIVGKMGFSTAFFFFFFFLFRFRHMRRAWFCRILTVESKVSKFSLLISFIMPKYWLFQTITTTRFFDERVVFDVIWNFISLAADRTVIAYATHIYIYTLRNLVSQAMPR